MSFDPDNEMAFVQQQQGPAPHNYARFHRVWKRNNFKSQAEGTEVGEWRDYVIIISPGQSKTEVDREVKEADKRDYREQWEAYKANKEQIDGGTPLTLLPGMDERRAASFKVLYCMTIEQLANLSDDAMQQCGMGAAEWRERARKFVSGNKAKDAELEEAKRQIAELRERLAALENTPKRGRQKKAEPAVVNIN